MGRLLHKEDFISSPPLLNTREYFSSGQVPRTEVEIIENFPERLAIHQDYIFGYNKVHGLEVAIRKYVERSLTGDVYVFPLELNFRYLSDNMLEIKRKFGYVPCENYVNVDHGYRLFYFENLTDAIPFRFMFADYIFDICAIHPKYTFLRSEQIEPIGLQPAWNPIL